MNEVKEIADIIFNSVIAIIGLGGGIFGAYRLFDGFTNDQPQEKKQGVMVLVITIVIISTLLILKGPLLSLAGLNG